MNENEIQTAPGPVVQEVPRIKSYDLPATEGVTPKKAKQMLSKMDADIIGDPLHPVNKREHPQRQEFQDVRAKLFAIQADPRTPLAKAMDEAMSNKEDKEAKKQAERIRQAEVEMAQLVKLGYCEKEPIPDNINQRQVDVLAMRRMCVGKDFESLKPVISKNLSNLHAPQYIHNLFRTLRESSEFAPTLRQVAEDIVDWINGERKKREG